MANVKNKKEEFDTEQMIRYMNLSAKKKLEYLEAMNNFLNMAMPAKSKLIWKKLKKLGW